MARKVSVLVVEDDAADQRLVRKYLERLNYEVAAIVPTATAAIRAAEVCQPDLALVHVPLDGVADGIDVAEILSDRFRVPVVLTGENADEKTLERVKSVGALGYVVKPYLQQQLATAIEMALAHHRMERALERQRSWFWAVISSLGEGVLVCDPTGSVLLVNRAATALLGTGDTPIIETPITQVFCPLPEADGTASEDPITAVLRTGEDVPARLYRITVHGEVRTFEGSARPVTDPATDRLGAVLVFRDVSERERANEAMLHAARTEAVSSLVSGVAHHFNNSLQVMMGHAELISQVMPPGNTAKSSADLIRRTCQRSTDLVGRLADLSQAGRAEPEPVAVRTLVSDLESLIRAAVPTSIAIELPPEVPADVVDARRQDVERAILHLIENARDAMPQGGTLSVQVASRNGSVAIGITDTGPGIPPEVKDRLFQPFASTKTHGHGNGLGLYSALTTAQQHGGTVEIESGPERGTTVRLVLPTSLRAPAGQRPVSDPAPAVETAPAAAPAGVTVLVVEDEDEVRDLVEKILSDRGYAVVSAGDARAALDILEAGRRVDLILTDLVMPGMNGIELAGAAQSICPEARVMFMSAYDESYTRTFVWKGAPIKRHLEKPFLLDTLVRTVEQALASPPGSTG